MSEKDRGKLVPVWERALARVSLKELKNTFLASDPAIKSETKPGSKTYHRIFRQGYPVHCQIGRPQITFQVRNPLRFAIKSADRLEISADLADAVELLAQRSRFFLHRSRSAIEGGGGTHQGRAFFNQLKQMCNVLFGPSASDRLFRHAMFSVASIRSQASLWLAPLDPAQLSSGQSCIAGIRKRAPDSCSCQGPNVPTRKASRILDRAGCVGEA